MTRMGDYVEVMLSTSDLTTSQAFFRRLNFEALNETTFTDGSYNLSLTTERKAAPTLRHFGSDIDAILEIFPPSDGSKEKKKRRGHMIFSDPAGRLNIELNHEASTLTMPAGSPTSRTPRSRLGKFGEFAIPVPNLGESLLFWGLLGYEPLHTATIPYPYAILSDGMLVIGLHETPDFKEATLTYFAADMGQRIDQLEAEGVELRRMGGGNAAMFTPDGQAFFLFTGEV